MKKRLLFVTAMLCFAPAKTEAKDESVWTICEPGCLTFTLDTKTASEVSAKEQTAIDKIAGYVGDTKGLSQSEIRALRRIKAIYVGINIEVVNYLNAERKWVVEKKAVEP